jgi:hypothetical protein
MILLLTGCQLGILKGVLCIQDAHCQIPGILSANSFGILNVHNLLRLEYNVRRLAHSKYWNPERQSLHTAR